MPQAHGRGRLPRTRIRNPRIPHLLLIRGIAGRDPTAPATATMTVAPTATTTITVAATMIVTAFLQQEGVIPAPVEVPGAK